jgi:hypothetical protein
LAGQSKGIPPPFHPNRRALKDPAKRCALPSSRGGSLGAVTKRGSGDATARAAISSPRGSPGSADSQGETRTTDRTKLFFQSSARIPLARLKWRFCSVPWRWAWTAASSHGHFYFRRQRSEARSWCTARQVHRACQVHSPCVHARACSDDSNRAKLEPRTSRARPTSL